MTVAMIVAHANDRVIGVKNKLPWNVPEDMAFFVGMTKHYRNVLVGRKTYESIGRPLPGREMFVLSRTLEPSEGITVFRTVEEVKAFLADGRNDLIVAGGTEIYELMLPLCDVLYVSKIKGSFEGDAFFPFYEDRFSVKSVLLKTEQVEVFQMEPSVPA